ncbi:MAG: hypothetical protein CVV57_09750 [Tenericutes bacterium HGW-Tenericutes-2]|jgi:tetrahydromethanopterin S-methyltransferase subunit F|nr:MAG: hypothetical protein CVV58_01270 [Tenericutes bacterium HGW-Tenericutes-3]PKK97927.1 MAG: hypothetical protein CVV57_09750 [Tenericutes bacterium HGW-Tenericutes-2]
MKEETETHKTNQLNEFEKDKIKSLNQFFMKSITHGLLFAFLLFIITVVLLLFTIIATDMDSSVKITIISMVATFVLTSSKTLMDRTVEIITYTVRLLGEEQRGFNKKIGIDIDPVEFEELSDDNNKEEKKNA